jgi:hypothetical protein
MRSAIYHGLLIDTIKSLNEHDNWRAIFGKVNPRLKDQELILRFLALYFNSNKYQRPMDEFLSGFAKRYREPGEEFLNEASNMFIKTVDAFKDALGRRAFRPGQAINAAVFDSMTVGLARRIHGSGIPNPDQIVSAHADLLKDSDHMEAVSRSTGDKGFVFRRLDKATKRFAEL